VKNTPEKDKREWLEEKIVSSYFSSKKKAAGCTGTPDSLCFFQSAA
jgi:hypothetical protein